MTRPVVLSPRAERHLATIYQYVLASSGVARADLVISRLSDACRQLAYFPSRGAARDDLFPGLRVMGYRRQATIAFTIEPDTVTIQGIMLRGRDTPSLLDD